ncbi:protein rep [Bacillus sp. FSL R12-0069]|uniref:protein rep n=1 Tax=Bacillus sp. FSL R12-0069 TaxID=2975342 RepID=UPI0030F7E5A7
MCFQNNKTDRKSQEKIIKNRFLDTTKSGKEVPWKDKKIKNQSVADSFHDAGLKKKAGLVKTCANVLQFKRVEGGLKLAHAWFCKVRLCPICNWRRSMKIAQQNREIVLEANKREKLRWIFLTLTTGQTVEGKDLKERIEHSMKSFNRLMKYKRVDDVVRGYFRGLEVTKSKGKYHPHFHVLIAVKPSYFKDKYIKQNDWSEIWQKALKLDFKPTVDIRAVKPNEKHRKLTEDNVKEFEGALQEVSKYPVKDTEFLKGDRQESAMTVYTMDKSLSYKRLIGYGGLLKEIRKELQLKDVEGDGADLIKIDDRAEEEHDISDEIEFVTAYWHYGIKDYVISE